MNVRRFEHVFPVGGGRLLLNDVQRSNKVTQWLLFDPAAKRVVRSPNGPGPLSVDKWHFSILDLIRGSTADKLIALVANERTAAVVAQSMNAPAVATQCKGEMQCLVFVTFSGELPSLGLARR